MSSQQNCKRPSARERQKGFKIHAMVYLGVIGFNWFTWLSTGGGYPWPMWPMMGWGLGLFFHYVGAVLAPRWSTDGYQMEEDYDSANEREEYISSEYRNDEPLQRPRQRSFREDWDGVNVEVHDIDEK